MTPPRAPHAGGPARRRTRDSPAGGRRPDAGRVRPCGPRPATGAGGVGVELVTGLAGPADRLRPQYSCEQATTLASAAAADTIRAVRAVPCRARAAVPLEWAFAGTRRRSGPALLVSTEVPQLSPDLLSGAIGLLGDFDAVLGPTTGDGWWAFGLREPAHAVLGASTGLGSLTVAALRLGLRVAMLPTLHGLSTGADVRPVAAHCPAGSLFAAAVARLAYNALPQG
ncbi:DUF2064 domain-containing protein [Actinoplanes sp. NPDC049118]|uniref:DUF2064 domain-containing protein n=1 Tax=Actinoplanes sp. NPDC049118 TaxID=3155769 RepID=UPI0034045F3F